MRWMPTDRLFLLRDPVRPAAPAAAPVVEPRIVDLRPAQALLETRVLDGLRRTPKTLPCLLFYDAAGAALFERICATPEYYLTRTELAILDRQRASIADAVGDSASVIDLGSGSTRKARALLEILPEPDSYTAIDVCGEQLRARLPELAQAFPGLPVAGIVADFGDHTFLPLGSLARSRRIAFFPGSTIGNWEPDDALRLLTNWHRRLIGGGMLVGVDTVKDDARLEAAYNDAAGVTAAFNRNLLLRINRELGANFRVEAFEHRASFDRGRGCIEMQLVSRCRQRVRIGAEAIDFDAGEPIRTERSYKYSIPCFQAVARAAGFEPQHVWTDERQWFAVHFLAA
jgi:dimethylhistidine N-methyltransferase